MEEEGERESVVKVIRGLPRQFTVTAKSFPDVVVKYLDISIHCNAQNDSPWSCPCTVSVRLVSQVVEEDYTRKFFHIFHEGSNRLNIDDFVTSETARVSMRTAPSELQLIWLRNDNDGTNQRKLWNTALFDTCQFGLHHVIFGAGYVRHLAQVTVSPIKQPKNAQFGRGFDVQPRFHIGSSKMILN
ncbi:hypothetical protein niasHT_025807 [Heterodera trifolii]|uniref:Uncharacterized protein n=1 Tax=Heterodera trifolii TaxID=157864 RepID=A0ABD2KT60_9BILA